MKRLNREYLNWAWSPLPLAAFRFGGLAAFFGDATWHFLKAVGSSASRSRPHARGEDS